MATEKELSFPIEDWRGVNRNVDREDSLPNHLYSAKNLWENKLGILETRWGSEDLATLPSNIIKTMSAYTLYKKDGTKFRMAAVQCDIASGILNDNEEDLFANFPTGLSVSLVNNANGYWSNDNTIGATTYSGKHLYLYIRLIGFGIDQWYTLNYTSVSGYAAATSQSLNVVVSQALDSNITGIEIYCGIDMGVGAATTSQSLTAMWTGYIDLVSNPTGTFSFTYCPQGQNIARSIASPTTRGETQRTFSYRVNSTGGTLVGGKTYYIAIVPHYQVWSSTAANQRSCLRNPAVNPDTITDFIPVTIEGTGTTNSIEIYGISAETVGFVAAIGESPYMMKPHSFWNESSNFTGGFITDVVTIDSIPLGSPALFDFSWTSASEGNLQFRMSDFGVEDCLIKIEDDGTVYPIHISRQDRAANDSSIQPWIYLAGPYQNRGAITNNAHLFESGRGSKYDFISIDNLCFFVSDYSALTYPDAGVDYEILSGVTYNSTVNQYHRTGTNYFQTDGYSAGCVIEEYQATQIYLPQFKYIAEFDGSVLLCGGDPSTSPYNGVTEDSRRKIYVSDALNPYNFIVAGGTNHRFLSVNEGEEDINGIGVYSNTSIDTGPTTQLLISKKNSFHILNSIPDDNGGNIGSYTIQMITRKAGGAGHDLIVNTPVGTVVVGVDNVYLIRGNGEPAPIGQEISDILKGADLTYGFACYHDRHVKVSFFHSDYSGTSGQNNVEFWLNVNKMIEGKGQADWVGPMTGRSVQHCFVEDRDGDGLKYNNARDRITCDGSTPRIYIADVQPLESDTSILDFATAVTAELETKDFEISPQDNNWNKLIKRTYWKIRTNKLSASPLTGTNTLYVDGASFEAKAVSFYANAAGNFNSQPLKLNSVFHTGRARGRTFRHKFSTSDRVAIGGLQMNYQVERRRID